MRKIGFRGKRLSNGTWVHGYLYESYPCGNEPGGTWILSNTNGQEPNMIAVAASSVGEYAGKRDSNGNLVFEGDIIAATFEPRRATENPETVLGVVEWWSEKAEFTVNCMALKGVELGDIQQRTGYKYADGRFSMTFAEKGKVIGNIHDLKQ